MNEKKRFTVGIDPGSKTGLAVIDIDGKIVRLATMDIVSAMEEIVEFHVDNMIYIEDARTRKWFGRSGREKLQGAGSIKRECKIWETFCIHHGLRYKMIAPIKGATKMDKELFKRVTGWTERTSEHSRDAYFIAGGKGNGL